MTHPVFSTEPAASAKCSASALNLKGDSQNAGMDIGEGCPPTNVRDTL